MEGEQVKKRFVALTTVAALVIFLLPWLPQTAQAGGNPTFDIAQGNITISYHDSSTFEVVYYSAPSVAHDVYIADAQPVTITDSSPSSPTGNVVTVSGSGSAYTVKITLSGVNIESDIGSPFSIGSGATVSLTVEGTNTLNAGTSFYAGLGVPGGATLDVLADSTGSLASTGGSDSGAGIGGGAGTGYNPGGNGGTVTINGGTVSATGAVSGSGIGGGGSATGFGDGGNGGNVTINGGTVTANGGNDGGAGIGGGASESGLPGLYGNGGNGGTVTINGGTVTANAGNGGYSGGAGIGGGGSVNTGGNGGTVTINGGTVSATGTLGGSGIGGGGGNSGNGGGGTAIIDGGSVDASVQSAVYNSSTIQEYLVTVTGLPATTPVSYTVNGGSAVNCATDSSGNLYLWLPTSVQEIAITVGGVQYEASGTISTGSNNFTALIVTPAPVITTSPVYAGTNVIVSGTGAVGATVYLDDNGTQVGTTTASGGNWSYAFPSLAAGDQLTACAQAAGEALSSVSSTVTVQAAQTPAPVITTSPVYAGTNVIVSGTAAVGATVYLDDNGTQVGTTTASGGNWSYAFPSLAAGDQLTACAQAAGEALSSVSSTVTVQAAQTYSGGGGWVSLAPNVETNTTTSITSTSAVLSGDVTSDNGFDVTDYGFLWGTDSGTLANKLDVGANNQSGAFTSTLDSLAAGTTYYFAAYATNSQGTADGAVLSFTTTSSTPVAPPAATFSDVPSTYWACGAIESLAGQGIVSGYPDGTFKPGNPITRAEFCAIMDKVLKLQAGNSAVTGFDDVSQDNWFYQAVESSVYAGIAKGYGNGAFRPDANITREELACVLVNALGQQNEAMADMNAKTSFTDDISISWWARGFVVVAVKDGLLKGYPDGSFRPQGDATRAEACAMIGNFLNYSQGR
jgi:hypothetical protein